MSAQAQSFLSDPTVWVSVSYGALTWAPSELEAHQRDNIAYNLSVSWVLGDWMLKSGLQVSDYWGLFGNSPSPPSSDMPAGSLNPVTYQSLYLTVGRWGASEWFMAGASVGPALTVGKQVRRMECLDGAVCVAGAVEIEEVPYLNLGLAGSVQGFVRLDGRVWIGAETMAIVNPSSSHLATRLAIRVDLLRPGR